MIYKSLLALLFSLVILLPGKGQTEESQFLQKHIEQIIKQNDYAIGGEPFNAHKLLFTIYSKNNFQLLWHRPNSVRQLFEAISSSALEGLTPNDYHLRALLLLQKKKKAGVDYPTLNANFDLLLTDAFIRLAYDKSFGKVDPQHLHAEWNLPEKTIQQDPATTIEVSILNGNVGKLLSSLSPQSVLYTRLKNALAKYTLIKQRGGWPAVSTGPVLEQGMQGPRVQELRDRLFRSGDLAVKNQFSPLFDQELAQAVSRFQKRHYLDADGIAGKQTLAELNTPVEQKIDQIRVNLERARWVLHDLPSSFILVDIAGFSLHYYQNNKQIWQTRIIVGLPYHTTPTFESSIKYIVLNPTWTIPHSIIKRETLPKIKKNPNYLQEHNLRILDHKGRNIAEKSINWSSYTGKNFPYLIRQNPGPHNALGRIKFIFPNKHSIYLHDTPHRELFSKERRAFSHGCIRVNDPLTLGQLILTNDGQDWDKERINQVITKEKTTRVNLKTPLPVMLLYWTVNAANSNEILFKQDIYNRDPQLLKALDGPFRARSSVAKKIGL